MSRAASREARLPEESPAPVRGRHHGRGRGRAPTPTAFPEAIRTLLSRRPPEELESQVERVLRANANGLTLLGLTLGVFVSRKFFVLPVAVWAMLLQDALARGARARGALSGVHRTAASFFRATISGPSPRIGRPHAHVGVEEADGRRRGSTMIMTSQAHSTSVQT
jgi:hypothetical protein